MNLRAKARRGVNIIGDYIPTRLHVQYHVFPCQYFYKCSNFVERRCPKQRRYTCSDCRSWEKEPLTTKAEEETYMRNFLKLCTENTQKAMLK
jgi:hypothetical protein